MVNSWCELRWALVTLVFAGFCGVVRADPISVPIVIETSAAPRVEYGARQLAAAMKSADYVVNVTNQMPDEVGARVIVRTSGNAHGKQEGFSLSCHGHEITITGNDDSGTLYGCLELARRVRETKKL